MPLMTGSTTEPESLWPVFRVVLGLSAVGLTVATAWFASFPGGLPGELGATVLAILMSVAWLALVLAVVAGLVAAAVPSWRVRLGNGDVALVSLGVLLVAIGIASSLGAALRVRLALSAAALEQRALAYRDGDRGSGGGGGYYDVLRVQPGPAGALVLVTNRCGLGDCGFAYSPGRRPPGVCADSDYQVYSPLTGPWYVAELYASGPCG